MQHHAINTFFNYGFETHLKNNKLSCKFQIEENKYVHLNHVHKFVHVNYLF
jgi:hypothetical protein